MTITITVTGHAEQLLKALCEVADTTSLGDAWEQEGVRKFTVRLVIGDPDLVGAGDLAPVNAAQFTEFDETVGASSSVVGQAGPAPFALESFAPDEAAAAQVVKVFEPPDAAEPDRGWSPGDVKDGNGSGSGHIGERSRGGLDDDDAFAAELPKE